MSGWLHLARLFARRLLVLFLAVSLFGAFVEWGWPWETWGGVRLLVALCAFCAALMTMLDPNGDTLP